MIELIVVIALVAIMHAIADPKFQSFYVKNITSSANSELMSYLTKEKSVDSTRNEYIFVCQSKFEKNQVFLKVAGTIFSVAAGASHP